MLLGKHFKLRTNISTEVGQHSEVPTIAILNPYNFFNQVGFPTCLMIVKQALQILIYSY